MKFCYVISTIIKHVGFIQEEKAMQYPGEISFKSGLQVRYEVLFISAVSLELKIITRN